MTSGLFKLASFYDGSFCMCILYVLYLRRMRRKDYILPEEDGKEGFVRRMRREDHILTEVNYFLPEED